ncbi:hypothetical protein MUO83_08480 [Candidatus Bathyarchaeota archaeon]|nr:hypothetical protein [Candidatus Bathyarchaeota archaeon]
MVRSEFEERIGEFEEILQKVAGEMANGMLFEKLPPSELLKKASEAKSSVISIQASEDVQPLFKYVLGRIDEFNAALVGLEKKVDEMKQIACELQEESLESLASKAPAQSMKDERKTEKKQLSLSKFRVEEKVEGNSHVND